MKTLDIRFAKERDSKRIEMQQKLIVRLQEVLPKRIAEKFADVNVRIRLSSSQGVDVTGFKGEEKTKFLDFLEELWNDSSLVDDIE